MHVWRLIAYTPYHEGAHRDTAINWFRASSVIAIGWGRIGDLRGLQGPEEIRDRIQQAYPGLPNAHLGGPSLWRLYGGVRIGDLVIVSDAERRRMVMRVTGDYQFSSVAPPPEIGDYQHQRPAEYVERDPNQLWTEPAAGENVR